VRMQLGSAMAMAALWDLFDLEGTKVKSSALRYTFQDGHLLTESSKAWERDLVFILCFCCRSCLSSLETILKDSLSFE
jgi:hypothetical protein